GLAVARRRELQGRRGGRCLLALAAVLVAGCSDTGTGPEQGTDPQPTPDYPLAGFVTVAPGVSLHYLDFGGEGDPVLLLAGLGNTANVFREFAPLLTDHYRVLALTRRGFGRSSQPSSGYDPATLARDIAAVLDSLGIQKIDLIGHSIAGEEMSRFAVDHPQRLGRLVYLDAAYDRTLPSESPTPVWAVPPGPTVADVASRTAFQTFLSGVLGVRFPLEEVAATTVVANDGTVAGYVTPSSINQAILTTVEKPDYATIEAPALAIYAIPDTPDDVAPWLSPGSAAWDSAQAWIDSETVPARREQIALFESSVPNGVAVVLEGVNHYLFIEKQTEVLAAVLSFLGGG
ncbi:MAG TPA: alpha/beta hydrolase, partial [Longimicrobiales bacterium]|nr:alpha/beta hydrolase [Longimicrobiales bacterium]